MKKIILILALTMIASCKKNEPCPDPASARVTDPADARQKCVAPLFVLKSTWTRDNGDIICQELPGMCLVDIYEIEDVDQRIEWLRKNTTHIDFPASKNAILNAHLVRQVPATGVYYNIKLSQMKAKIDPSFFDNKYSHFMQVWIANGKVEVAAVDDFDTQGAKFSFPFIIAAAEAYSDDEDPEFGFKFENNHMYIRMIKSGSQDVHFNISTDPAYMSFK